MGLDFINIFLRSTVSILTLFILTRLMGKKQISQLNFFDYIVGITIGSIAAELSVNTTIPYQNVIIGLIVWSSFSIILSFITLKSIKARHRLEGTSTILIQNGEILYKNLRKERFHVNDLLEELRMKGAFNVSDVEFAILETNGQVSVLLKSHKQPVTVSDLNIKPDYQGLCCNLIIDGQIMENNLNIIGFDRTRLFDEIKKHNINSIKKILLATLDSKQQIHFYIKNDLDVLNILD